MGHWYTSWTSQCDRVFQWRHFRSCVCNQENLCLQLHGSQDTLTPWLIFFWPAWLDIDGIWSPTDVRHVRHRLTSHLHCIRAPVVGHRPDVPPIVRVCLRHTPDLNDPQTRTSHHVASVLHAANVHIIRPEVEDPDTRTDAEIATAIPSEEHKEQRDSLIEHVFRAPLDYLRRHAQCFVQCFCQVLTKKTGVQNERDHDFSLRDHTFKLSLDPDIFRNMHGKVNMRLIIIHSDKFFGIRNINPGTFSKRPNSTDTIKWNRIRCENIIALCDNGIKIVQTRWTNHYHTIWLRPQCICHCC